MSARLLASVGALALAASLSSCGFDYATNRNYQVTAGTTNRDASVDVLSAVIVSAQPGSGTLITSFSNNDPTQSATVTAVAGSGDSSDVQVKNFQPIDVPGGGMVNLATGGQGIVLKAPDLEAGGFEALTFTFGDGSTEELEIPVLPPCNEFEGLDTSAGASATPSPDQCEAPSSSVFPETGESSGAPE